MEALEYGTNDKTTYLKITLRKLVLFMNSMAYQDYLAQHARFVFREGNRDRYTDSWTTIEGEQSTCACKNPINELHLILSDCTSGWLHPKTACSTHGVGERSSCATAHLLDLYTDWNDSPLSNLGLQKLRHF